MNFGRNFAFDGSIIFQVAFSLPDLGSAEWFFTDFKEFFVQTIIALIILSSYFQLIKNFLFN